MAVTESDLYALLDKLGITHRTIEHPPIFTVEDGRALGVEIPGLDCKNLFLKDKAGKIWLVVMPGAKRAHLARLERTIGSARLSFGKPELLAEVLGIAPGHVTPFALMNDVAQHVTVVLDSEMMQAGLVNFHPLRNTASTCLQATDLMKFIRHLGYSPLMADCGDWVEN